MPADRGVPGLPLRRRRQLHRIGDPGALQAAGAGNFRLTERFDDLVFDRLRENPSTLYVNCSSGAVYGTDFRKPATGRTRLQVDVNALTPDTHYGIAKLNAEAKHRALGGLSIVDLRIFGYFTRHIAPDARFLLAEAVTCLRGGKTMTTGPEDIVRDYVHPDDLLALLGKCMAGRPAQCRVRRLQPRPRA